MAPKMTQDEDEIAEDGVLGTIFGHDGCVSRPGCANVALERMSESRDSCDSSFPKRKE